MEFRELLKAPGPVILDGGMGTMLQAKGLKLGEHPELAALEHPDWLLDIHRAYVEAGTQILCANTFGANREKLKRTGKTVEEVIPPSIAIAREAAAGKALVALDLGHNRVHDWSFLQYMPNLKILIAVDNQVKDLSWIQYTPKLEYLEFFVGYVTDLSFLQYTPNLKDLNISYNRVSDATYLYNLPNLERLWMEHTRIPYSEFQKLKETYPNAKIVRNGEGSIDQGWRTHERYYAMRDMFKNNYVHELFMD